MSIARLLPPGEALISEALLALPLLSVGHGVAIGILHGTTHLIRLTRETHEVPSGVQECATRAGGVNRYGEPRLSRGVGRLPACVDWETLDRSRCARKRHSRKVELRRVPKYLPEERWHIERWMPAESYGSPERWLAQATEIEDGVRLTSLDRTPGVATTKIASRSKALGARSFHSRGGVRLDCRGDRMVAAAVAHGNAWGYRGQENAPFG